MNFSLYEISKIAPRCKLHISLSRNDIDHLHGALKFDKITLMALARLHITNRIRHAHKSEL